MKELPIITTIPTNPKTIPTINVTPLNPAMTKCSSIFPKVFPTGHVSSQSTQEHGYPF